MVDMADMKGDLSTYLWPHQETRLVEESGTHPAASRVSHHLGDAVDSLW